MTAQTSHSADDDSPGTRRGDTDHLDADHVDMIIEQWGEQRPDIDVSGMAIIGRISRLIQALRPRLDAIFAKHDLESWEFDVLATLLRSGPPHRLTPGQLMEASMITSGAMTNRLKRLQDRGYIRREVSPTDRRQVLVTLTPAGKHVVNAALVDHAANEAAIVGALNAEQQAELANLLRQLSLTLE